MVVVTPSCAITIVGMTVLPTARAIFPLVVPDVTAEPLTFTVALGSVVVGVMVTEGMALATLSV